jgi:hypothetical protein
MLHKNKSVFLALAAHFLGISCACLPFVRLLTCVRALLRFKLAAEMLKKCHIFWRFTQIFVFLRLKGPEKDDLARFLLLVA